MDLYINGCTIDSGHSWLNQVLVNMDNIYILNLSFNEDGKAVPVGGPPWSAETYFVDNIR